MVGKKGRGREGLVGFGDYLMMEALDHRRFRKNEGQILV